MTPDKGLLKKNLTRHKWNLKGGLKVHVIYNFYCFFMSKIQQNTASRKIQLCDCFIRIIFIKY